MINDHVVMNILIVIKTLQYQPQQKLTKNKDKLVRL